MKDFISVYDNALTSEECEMIISYFNISDDIHPGCQGNAKEDKSAKDSLDVFCNFAWKNNINETILRSLEECGLQYVKENPQVNNQLSKWQIDPEYNIQKYDPTQGYHKLHCENDGRDTSYRMMVWMIYLNTVTDGGGTYFDNYDRITDAVEGRVVLWPAGWTHCHKGIVSNTQTKYIATGWFSFTGVDKPETGTSTVEEKHDIIIRKWEHHDYFKDAFLEEAESSKWPMSYKSNVQGKMSGWHQESKILTKMSEWVKSIIESEHSIISTDLKVHDLWYAKYDVGDSANPHCHHPSSWSFVYFLNSPSGSSSLVFTNSGSQVAPEEGTVVIFDSSVMHHVNPNQCDGRYVIAGNVSWRPELNGSYLFDHT